MGLDGAKKLFDVVMFMPDSWHDTAHYKTRIGVGQAIKKVSRETQALFRLLTSDDIRNVDFGDAKIGPDYPVNWYTEQLVSCFLSKREAASQQHWEELRKLKLEFDRKILKK